MTLDSLNAANLILLAKALLFGATLLWLVKLQKNPTNGINLLEFIQDPKSDKLSAIRLAYVVALWATTYKFISTPMTAPELSTVMLAYGGLWVVGQAAVKFADRPPDPAGQVPPAAGVVVNNQPGAGPTNG